VVDELVADWNHADMAVAMPLSTISRSREGNRDIIIIIVRRGRLHMAFKEQLDDPARPTSFMLLRTIRNI